MDIVAHKKFLKRILYVLPEAFEELEASRLTLLFFVLSGLDILDEIDSLSDEVKTKLVDWIYSLQITCKSGEDTNLSGFEGTFMMSGQQVKRCNSPGDVSRTSTLDSTCLQEYSSLQSTSTSHLVMTYSALVSLAILGDDFGRLNHRSILRNVQKCQLMDGSFQANPMGSENDMRFVFCAVAICYILDDFSPLNVESLLSFMKSCLVSGSSFTRGSTYCAAAALTLLNQLDEFLNSRQRSKLLRWCVMKQDNGFHGRPNKPDDSCYTFWIGATLRILNAIQLVDRDAVTSFTLSTQDENVGGFGKFFDSLPDALHTYLSLSGLALLDYPGLQPVFAPLNVTVRTSDRISWLRKARSNGLPVVWNYGCAEF
ncbi:unnamed protein product [Soboliphyme baturini]|uniref:Geranylgeranyl transferase type I subunit beta n=1 Tax=Soboliphyme baturini TaxID=241478 RepID=A0A183IRI5_9BILA|nr:unnamed protein product [Soboliphyme baturini]